jgi:adenylylsulfate reductase subunit B
MSITIDQKKCRGCGKCQQVCPGNLLTQNDKGKACIQQPKDCWGCTSCVKECAYQAIYYYLGADIGGRGSLLFTKKENGFLHWHVISPEGKETVITIDQQKANAY